MVRLVIIFVVINCAVLSFAGETSKPAPPNLRDGKFHQTACADLKPLAEQLTPAIIQFLQDNGTVVKQFCIEKIVYSYFSSIGADNDQYRNVIIAELNNEDVLCNVKTFVGIIGRMLASDVECYPIPKPYSPSCSCIGLC